MAASGDGFWGALGPVLFLGSYFFIGLIAYVLRSMVRGGYRDAEMESRGKTAIIGMAPRQYFAWVMKPIWSGLVKLDVPADAITTLSVLLACGAGVAIATGRFALGGWLYIFAGVCDFVDGRLARARGRATPAGAALDSVLDRYSESAVFLGLAWYYRGSWVMPVVLLALIGSHLIPYVRARGEGLGVEVKMGVLQRPERLVMIGLSVAFSPMVEAIFAPGDPHPIHRLPVAVLAVMAVGTHFTAIQRLIHVRNALHPGLEDGWLHPAARGGIGRTALAAGVATGADAALVSFLVHGLTFPPWAATALGCLLGGVVNFTINRFWTFKSSAPPIGQAGKYVFVSLTSAALNAGGVTVLLWIPGLATMAAWGIARALVFATWNYPLHRGYVYADALPDAARLDATAPRKPRPPRPHSTKDRAA